jgi:ankyrin repeat protein
MVLINLSSNEIHELGKDKVSEYVWLRKKDKTVEDAAKNGNLIGLTYLVEECKEDIYNKENALEIASENGHLYIVKYLNKQFINIIDRLSKADKDSDDYYEYEYAEYIFGFNNTKNRALKLSSKHGYLDIVKYLVEECNANIQGHDDDYLDDRPLCISIEHDHFEVVKYLVEKG